MKKILFICMLISATGAQAQEEVLPKPAAANDAGRRNELGLFAQTAASSNNSYDLSFLGAQYKRWVRPNVGYRTIAGMGNYTETKLNQVGSVANDTFTLKSHRTSVNMAMLGGGLEAQRHFFKSVYLYAALELRLGYGTGFADTIVEQQYKEMGNDTYYSRYAGIRNTGPNTSMVYIGFAPSVGAKLQWSRIAIGYELSPGEMSVRAISHASYQYSLFDAGLGDFRQRFFIHYRF